LANIFDVLLQASRHLMYKIDYTINEFANLTRQGCWVLGKNVYCVFSKKRMDDSVLLCALFSLLSNCIVFSLWASCSFVFSVHMLPAPHAEDSDHQFDFSLKYSPCINVFLMPLYSEVLRSYAARRRAMPSAH